MTAVPTVDVAPFVGGSPEQRRRVVAEVGAALEDCGSLTIVGHGVAPAIIARADAAYRAFFARSQADKRACAAPDPAWLRGFYGASAVDCHHSTFSAANYPAQHDPPLPGQVRCGVHTDYGSMTILHQDDAPGGLQVQRPDGAWMDVTPVRGGLVVNLGDTMLEWTSGRWKSPPHRVVNPPAELAASTRQSLLFFHCPNYDTVLAPIPSSAGADASTSGPWPTVGELIFRKSMQATKTAAS